MPQQSDRHQAMYELRENATNPTSHMTVEGFEAALAEILGAEKFVVRVSTESVWTLLPIAECDDESNAELIVHALNAYSPSHLFSYARQEPQDVGVET